MSKTVLNRELSAFIFGIALVFVTAIPTLDASPRARVAFLAPPRVEHFTFGLQEQTADAFWIRAVQDFDYCENPIKDRPCPQSKLSWLYQMLDLVTTLAPEFRMPYATGGLALTVVVNDIEGASLLFDKGVQHFPNDWPILSRAAYHAMFEERKTVKAGDLLQRAAKAGGPAWFNDMAARLYIQGDRNELAEQLIREIEHEDPNSPVAAAMRKKWAGKLPVDSQ